ncbi:dihydroxyacetone kinase [Metarhizium album ARSEF 1941]|uniref:Dihydroxyacetone kinase n=1 Tax=Metarhizium album (strain ARSEF 1941) TaxID=1081103 RepID=A0A0B2WMZ3_METAS|nr:dihydroxyacetone kinase [Metarhizium album ARSEF 1941]KHN95059.1 dihydroxyacetone kinase [Metarhizium album ARSEF 1941]
MGAAIANQLTARQAIVLGSGGQLHTEATIITKRHLFNSAEGHVNKALKGIVAYDPSLSFDETNRVVYDSSHDRSKVSIIGGGGSGHEPAWAGYVGTNMLTASVQEDMFASPSTRQILAGVEAVPSDKGTILVITNYTGDCLHFGLANEKANARGHSCRIIICGDDVSNFGAMPHLEMGALVDELLEQLRRRRNMEPVRICDGFLETSLNALPFPSPSTMPLPRQGTAGTRSRISRPSSTPGPIRTGSPWQAPRLRGEVAVDERRDLKLDPVLLESMLRNACVPLVKAEPDLTGWDTVMGDGDCGETLKAGATGLMAALDGGLARPGPVVKVLLEPGEIVEGKMGGTLADTQGPVALWATALSAALGNLRRYTPAKVGDRTVMDTLIPFAEALSKSGWRGRVQAAVDGAEATKKMKPRLGRAAYVGAGSGDGQELPPDPDAWGAMVAIRGLQEVASG